MHINNTARHLHWKRVKILIRKRTGQDKCGSFWLVEICSTCSKMWYIALCTCVAVNLSSRSVRCWQIMLFVLIYISKSHICQGEHVDHGRDQGWNTGILYMGTGMALITVEIHVTYQVPGAEISLWSLYLYKFYFDSPGTHVTALIVRQYCQTVIIAIAWGAS